MERWSVWLGIGIGGALGAVARYAISRAVQQSTLSSFPYGTLVVNLIGCLLLGFLFISLQRVSEEWRLAVNVGFIGAMTTFSTYCLESLVLVENRQYFAAAINVGGSVILGLAATLAGMIAAKTLLG